MAEAERLLPQAVEEGRKVGFVTEILHQVSRHGLHEDDDHVAARGQAVGFHAACDGRDAVHALPSEEGLHAGYGFVFRHEVQEAVFLPVVVDGTGHQVEYRVNS